MKSRRNLKHLEEMTEIYALIALIAAVAVGMLFGFSIGCNSRKNSEESVSDAIEESFVAKSTYETTDIVSIDEEIQEAPKYTEDELFCMAATIYNEAGGDACSDDTRRLVGYVVLNRINDPRFPDTMREVLEAKNQYGRFCETGVKFADRCSLPQEQHAVERAYTIAREVLECDEIPIPPTVVFQSEFEQGTSIYRYQDGLYFCHAEEVS